MTRFPLISFGLHAVVALSALTVLTACETDVVGVETNYRSQWTTIQADVETVTAAAEEVLTALKLNDVSSNATGVDGQAVGTTADETVITVNVAKVVAGSEVTVTVGTLGDPDLGKAIVSDIQAKFAAAE
ncbi:MAG: DUF3568 family protein [Planctomycetota bacterium]